jgi:hypothetical protein
MPKKPIAGRLSLASSAARAQDSTGTIASFEDNSGGVYSERGRHCSVWSASIDVYEVISLIFLPESNRG